MGESKGDEGCSKCHCEVTLYYLKDHGDLGRFLKKINKKKKKSKFTPIFKKGRKECLGRNRLVSFNSVPEKMMEQLILELVANFMKGEEVSGICQQGFIKRR